MLFSVSATTREKRSAEIDGKDYYFISVQEFENRINKGELIEWENIYGDYYGSLKSEVDRAFSSGNSILFDVDVKGALSIKKKYSTDAVLIFIKPPSIDKLRERLKNRKTESEETFAKRMHRVEMELEQSKYFNYVVVNDLLDDAVGNVDQIIRNEITK